MLDNENKIPLYFQLVKTLRKQIEDTMKPNDRLPSEMEICDMYSLSRTTVRLAMAELEKSGYIYRLQGKGSFVSTLEQNTSNSFIELDDRKTIKALYQNDATMQIVAFEKTVVEGSVPHPIFQDKRILYVQALHSIKKQPAVLIEYFFDNRYFHTLNKKEFKSKTLDEILENLQVHIRAVEETYGIEDVSLEKASLLQVDRKSMLLKVTKNIFDNKNEIIISCTKHIVTQRYEYKNFIEK